MKRIIALLLMLCLLCGCSPAESWQEQYDLGVRLLSEENYEEAILAFTEAIRIDPKHVEAYVQLARVYENLGMVEELRALLAQGAEATGDPELAARLAALPPALSEAYLDHLREVKKLNDDYFHGYLPTSPELEEALAPVLEMCRGAEDLPADPMYLFSEEWAEAIRPWIAREEFRMVTTYRFWTLLTDGTLVRLTVSTEENDDWSSELQLRTLEGTGYYWYAYSGTPATLESGYWTFSYCGMKDYVFNGAFTETTDRWQPYPQSGGGEVRLYTREITTGAAVNEFLQGEIAEQTIRLEGPDSINNLTTYCTYDSGILQAAYTNEEGEAVYFRYVLEDGSRSWDGGRVAHTDRRISVVGAYDLPDA